MKTNVLLAASIAAGALGCAHAAPPPTEQVHTAPVAAAATAPAPAAAPEKQAQEDVAALLRGDVLHFGFDEAELTDESRTRLQQVSDAMRRHPELTLTISGNTDERGTEEYNLALGQRRAEVARKYLVGLGVDGARVKSVSYGKERPAQDGHSEQAWTENRRDEIQPSGN